MATYTTSVEIANRALQHLGARRITAFADTSKNAAAVDFVYDKLRQAELRRNVWKFAVTRTLIAADAAPTTAYIDGDIANQATLWAAGTYLTGAVVYKSLASPFTTYTPNVASTVQEPPNTEWTATNNTSLTIYDPWGGKSKFNVPANFLRMAPQDPKAGSRSPLGGPAGQAYGDWVLEGPHIVTTDVGPINLRYVKDVTNVGLMDPMFCEGLACRIAIEICEEITQSTDKLSNIASLYKQFMGEARSVNAVEIGSEEPAEDDWVTCRG